MSLDAAAAEAIINAAVSHALALGVFENVNGHEPESVPPVGITAAVWAQEIVAVRTSGLNSSSARLTLNVRLYTSMLARPPDAIDPRMLGAAATLMGAYAGDFTLGGLVREVDLQGEHGPPLGAVAGYLRQDDKLMRVITITAPLIINDCWDQEA